MSKPLSKPINDLLVKIATLPDDNVTYLQPELATFIQHCEHVQSMMCQIKTDMGDLRVDTKYLVFDLEATRRERDIYKQQLDTLR